MLLIFWSGVGVEGVSIEDICVAALLTGCSSEEDESEVTGGSSVVDT